MVLAQQGSKLKRSGSTHLNGRFEDLRFYDNAF